MDIIGQDGHIYKGRAGTRASTTLLTAVPKVRYNSLLLLLFIIIIISHVSVQLVGGQEVHHVLHQLSLHLNTSSSCTLNLMIPFNSLSIIIVIILKIKRCVLLMLVRP